MTTLSMSAPDVSQIKANQPVPLSPAKLAQRSNTTATTAHVIFEKSGYELRETIGIGGYSKVKLAVLRKTGEKVQCSNVEQTFTVPPDILPQVAVKIISKAKAPKGYLAKFLPREIAALRRLKHKNIVR